MPTSTARAYPTVALIATSRNSVLLRIGRYGERLAGVDIDARVRATGRRMTMQRRLVLDALRRARHHTTAEEIATRIRAKHPQVDPSTIYRNLEALEALGFVTHTHFEDRLTRWHLADAHRHGHLVCRGCQAEIEVPVATLEPLARRLRSEHGFEADLAHSAVVGLCRECAGSRTTIG